MTIAANHPANKQAQISLISGIAGWGAWVVFQFVAILTNILTFGIAGLFCTALGYLVLVPWVIAVVTGHRGLNQINQTGESGKVMAIVGLVLGYGGLLFTICTVVLYFAGVLTLITAIILAPTPTPIAP